MTLLELLVKELQKRGGWPESMACACKSRVDGEIYFYKKLHHDSRITKGLCDFSIYLSERDESESNHDGYIYVTRDQYQSELAESQKVEWSGAGLPPVGCNVEYIPCMLGPTSSDDNKPIDPTIIKVVAHEKYPNGGNNVVVGVWIAKSGGMRSSVFSPRCLVNIRSEADKKRDDAINSLTEFTLRGDACDIYNAIAAGKIPGVKLED